MMQRIKFFLLMLTVALIGSVNLVNAQSIVVEEETPPPEQSLSGYDGGFFIRSPDNNFKLTINGRVQPQFIYTRQKVAPAGIKLIGFEIRSLDLQRRTDNPGKKISLAQI